MGNGAKSFLEIYMPDELTGIQKKRMFSHYQFNVDKAKLEVNN